MSSSETTPEEQPQAALPPENNEAPKEEGAAAPDPALAPMSFFDHLKELRTRLVHATLAVLISFLACFALYAKELFNLLQMPMIKALPKGSSFIYTGPAEGLLTEMLVALVAGLLVASPFLFYQVWRFVAPGLYKEEKKYLIPISLSSALLFGGGVAFCYFVVFPYAFEYFMQFHTDFVKPMPSLKEYLEFALKLLFAFGFIFELPLFIFFLARLGIVNAQKLKNFRKYAILLAFILGAILAPPDALSQCLMAAPLVVLYELGILVARLFGKKTPAEAAAEKAPEAAEEKPASAPENPHS